MGLTNTEYGQEIRRIVIEFEFFYENRALTDSLKLIVPRNIKYIIRLVGTAL